MTDTPKPMSELIAQIEALSTYWQGGEYTVSRDSVLNIIRKHQPQAQSEVDEELPDAAIIAALEASLKFREERGVDNIQPDSPGGIAAEMVRVVYRAIRPYLTQRPVDLEVCKQE